MHKLGYTFLLKLNERESPMKIMFMTFGCKVNQYETECMKELFLSKGWELTDDLSAAEAPDARP